MKPKITHAMLEDAKQFVSYNIKEGVFSEDAWLDLSDEEFVAKANYERDKADAYADAMWKDE